MLYFSYCTIFCAGQLFGRALSTKGTLSGFVKRWVAVNGTYHVVSGHMISTRSLSGYVKRWVPVNGTYDVVLGYTISTRLSQVDG